MFQEKKSTQRSQCSMEGEAGESGLGAYEGGEECEGALKDGLWTQAEVFKFIAYLIYNKEALKLKLQRRTNKVFKQMAVFIASRTSVQCRSQNQRLFRKYKNIRNIVASFKEEYCRDRFEADYRAACDLPAIKFRTEYEKYLEGQVKKLADTATQTDPPSVVAPLGLDPLLPLPWLPDSLSNSNPFYPNWLIIPFYS